MNHTSRTYEQDKTKASKYVSVLVVIHRIPPCGHCIIRAIGKKAHSHKRHDALMSQM